MERKLTKAEVGYQDHPKATKRCENCSMFIKPDKCTLVRGEVADYGYCRRHDPK